jgi:hypothetical protein
MSPRGWRGRGTERAKRPRPDLATLLFVAIFVPLAGYLVFRLPFRFPPTGMMASPSLVFGFNNAVAFVAVVTLVGVVAVLRLWRQSRSSTPPAPWFSSARLESERIRTRVFASMAAAHVVLTLLMWASTRTSSAWRIDFEASHFLWRLQLMELFGARPYLDFQHEYGPALLYVPLLAHRLLAPAGVSLEAAYYLTYLAASVLGLWAIRVILDHAQAPRGRKEIAFCLLAAAALTPYMGLNGNLVRYLPPYVGVLLADRALSSSRGPLWAVLVVSVVGAVNILISPEIGLAFYLGWGGYCAFIALTDRRRALVGLTGLAATAALAGLTLPVQYAGSVLSFSAGAANFPLLPAAHIVLYLTTLFLVVPALLADAWSGQGRPAALLFAMGLVCVLMVPGALSRADPPHVLFFGLGVSLLLFVHAASRSRPAFVIYAITYTAVVIVGSHVSDARVFYDVSFRSVRLRDLVAFVGRREVEMTGAQLDRLSAYPPLGLPFCSYGTDRRTMAYLWSRGQIDPEYYCGIIGVYREAQLARKLADTTRHDYLLVRKAWLEPLDPCRRHVAIIRKSFVYDGSLQCRRDALEPDLAVSRAIVTHFRVAEELGPYVVMRRAADGS